MNKKYIISLIVLLIFISSCENKSEGYYFESQHRNGTKFINGLIHSKLNCDNVNGSIRKLGLDLKVDKGFEYAGVCHKCMTDKKTKEFVSWAKSSIYRDKAYEGFTSVYNIARKYYPDADSVQKEKFIKIAMIDNQANIERVYEHFNKSSGYELRLDFSDRDISNSIFLFDMEKERFLVRIRRWAEDYLDGTFYVYSEEQEQSIDIEYMEDEDWMRDRTQYGIK